MSEFAFNQTQHGELLTEISLSSEQIVRIAKEISDCSSDVDLVDALTGAIVVMASRVGWFAGLAKAGVGRPLESLSDAQYWLIPEACRPQSTGAQ